MNSETYLALLKRGGGWKKIFQSVKMFPFLISKIALCVDDAARVLFYSTQFLRIGKNVAISRQTSFGGIYNIAIGNNVRINQGCNLYGDYGIMIGDDTKLSPYVQIYSANYIFKKGTIVGSQGTKGKPVLIGDNVWIGASCVILPGIKIGDNSIIGALSLVNRNVPKNQLWAGNPAKFIRVIK